MTDAQLQLITAAIDGELSAADARRLQRLLDSSPEARETHARLKADSDRLRALPRVKPPADLQARVMRRVAALTPRPDRAPKAEPVAEPATVPFASPSRKWPAWLPAAAAASVMIGITASSFFFFQNTSGQNNANRTPGTNNVVNPNDWSKSLPDGNSLPSAPPPRPHIGNGSLVHHGPPLPPFVEPDMTRIAPEPRGVRPDLVAFPPIVAPKFEHLTIRIPFLKSVSDFDRPESRQELAEELARDPAFRVDVFSRDPARAVEVFQAAAKASGLHVHVDATTLDRLKKRQVTAVMIYTEALSATEVAEMFGHLSAADAKISPRVFDSLHAIPVSRTDERLVVETLGRDPGLFKRADIEKRQPKPDPSKPISDGTAQHIVDRVGSSGAGAVSPGAEKPAMLLAWAPPTMRTVPSASAELKQFFVKRGDRKPNVVPVVIVIRPGNG